MDAVDDIQPATALWWQNKIFEPNLTKKPYFIFQITNILNNYWFSLTCLYNAITFDLIGLLMSSLFYIILLPLKKV